MSAPIPPVGTVVLAGFRNGPAGLGQITRVGRHGGAPGAWVAAATGDPNTTVGYPTFTPDWCIKPAVVGVTVCEQPYGTHWCGLAHVTREELATLPRGAAS